jgi:GT2 family glycosyltransferase
MPVSVVVVNWNGLRHLRACLEALAGQTCGEFETVVVDNGSSDGSDAVVARDFPRVRLLCNAENRGFSLAVNQAIAATRTPLVALLNNDAVAEPDWLAALLSAAEKSPECGAFAGLLRFADRPALVNSAGIALDRTGIAWDRLGGAPIAAAARAEEIFGACGGAALYRRQMLEEIGPFDGDFFAYLEDVDLAWRAQLAGWRCRYVPTARATHVHSATAGEGSPFKNFLLGRNKIWTVVKNYPTHELLAYFPLVLAYDLASAPFRAFARGDASAFRGRLAALRALPRFLAKRRAVQARATPEGRAQAWRLMQPVELPWRVPRRYAHLTADGGRRTAPSPLPLGEG